MTDNLRALLSKYALAPCGDGGCILGHPGGMQTNGGCQHLKKDLIETRRDLQRIAMVLRQHTKDNETK